MGKVANKAKKKAKGGFKKEMKAAKALKKAKKKGKSKAIKKAKKALKKTKKKAQKAQKKANWEAAKSGTVGTELGYASTVPEVKQAIGRLDKTFQAEEARLTKSIASIKGESITTAYDTHYVTQRLALNTKT